jgi:hypothetical protein
MFQFNPVGILALVALALCWSLAALLNRLRDSLGISATDAETLER